MFSRRAPSEVYRVYGEDDLFTDSEEPTNTYPPAAPEEPPVLERLSEEHQPASSFHEYDTTEYEPVVQQPAPEPAYIPPRPHQQEPELDELALASGGLYGKAEGQRRNLGLYALGVLLALLLIGVIATGVLKPSPTQSHTNTSNPSAVQNVAVAPSTPSVTTQPPSRRATPAARRHRPRPLNSYRPPAVHHSAPASSPPRGAFTTAPSHSAPAPVSQPVAPVSAPAPSYAAPASSGPEFSFEH
ncbi:MAG TPA: hypothetical protein VID48_12575 [Solirubrobacteraceae bacterium]|jgi:hypothetical protein